MKEWLVPVTIVEHHREARVLADTAGEARRKARAAEWEDLQDAERYTVTVSGPAKESDAGEK